MRTGILRAGWIVVTSGVAACVLTGCASGDGQARQTNPADEGVTGPDAAIARQLEADAAELDRLRQDMVRTQGAHVDTGVNPRRPAPKQPASDAGQIAANVNERGATPLDTGSTPPALQGSVEPPPTLDQHVARLSAELAARLADRAEQDERPLPAILTLSSLELVNPSLASVSAAERRLTGAEANAAGAWRDAIRQASGELAGGATGDEAAEALLRAWTSAADRLRGASPIGIARAALCTKVDGFGRYTEFPGRAILAGRKQRAIVYIELDRFGHRPSTGPEGEPGFAVELTQDLSLYHEADGLLAWRKPEQEIADFSRNRRRDFFIVQMIDIPETLTIGKYTLKVRVRDKTGGAEAEVALPIEVVAQASLSGR